MQDRALQLGGAICIDATMVGFAFRADDIASAHRAVLGHREFPVAARVVLVVDDLDHFRNHVAAALDFHPVADSYAEAIDLVHVVERGAGNGGAANRDGFEPRHWSKLSSSAYLRNNVFDLRDAAAARALVGDGPTR